MNSVLFQKHIVLGITGSIAAYKAAILIRLLKKKGADVQVIITPSGKEFITPVTLSTLSDNPVISEFFTANTGSWNSHVDLGLWADAMIVAPASAATIGKMTTGVADNMLITTYLSMKAPVFVAPAMDLDMFAHQTTQDNLRRLASFGVKIIEPCEGELASHLTGKGRMQEPELIVEALEDFFLTKNKLSGKRVTITAGPSYERIDPVRFIGNFSSGKMGYAIAEAFASCGAHVDLVSGPTNLHTDNPLIKVHHVMSAIEMRDEVVRYFSESDIVVFCSAVADYRPMMYHDKKIKRENNENLSIELVANPDIAKEMCAQKRDDQLCIGFALENEHEDENAQNKLKKKNLDMIVLNSLSEEGAGFQHDTNSVHIFNDQGLIFSSGLKTKKEIAEDLVMLVTDTLDKRQSNK